MIPNKCVLHDSIKYNSFDTLVDNELVVLEYIREGAYSLMSMSLGHFYVARKCYNRVTGDVSYDLLSHDYFPRKSTEILAVTGNRKNLERFIEHKIVYWTELNDFNEDNITLCPIINGLYFNKPVLKTLNPLTGRLYNNGKSLKIENRYLTKTELFQSLYHRRGIYQLAKNSNYDAISKYPQFYNDLESCTLTELQQAESTLIANEFFDWMDGTALPPMPLFYFDFVYADNEYDIDMNQQLDVLKTPTYKKHETDLKTAMEDDYLLLN